MAELGNGVEIHVPRDVQKRVKELPTRAHYPTEDLIPEIPSGIGPKVWIPRRSLFGTHLQKEYEERKKVLAIKAFEEDPKGFLDNKPILTCLVPSVKGESRLIIIDGHHRFRESGRLRVKEGRGEKYLYEKVACKVFTPAEMADLLNKSGHLYERGDGITEPYTAESLIERLNRAADLALEDFRVKCLGIKLRYLLRQT